jgi:hypothetical protein
LYIKKVDLTTKGEAITGFNYVKPNATNPKTDSKAG